MWVACVADAINLLYTASSVTNGNTLRKEESEFSLES